MVNGNPTNDQLLVEIKLGHDHVLQDKRVPGLTYLEWVAKGFSALQDSVNWPTQITAALKDTLHIHFITDGIEPRSAQWYTKIFTRMTRSYTYDELDRVIGINGYVEKYLDKTTFYKDGKPLSPAEMIQFIEDWTTFRSNGSSGPMGGNGTN
jgi:uncharacterized lipoprotein YddW (UPF0748 family)